MKTTTSILFCLTVFLFQVLIASAETRYVSDQLYLSLRTGKSQQHKVIKTLKTDTPLEILEDSDDKYLKVRTQGGETGYVLKHYVTKEKPKSMLISRLKKENEAAGQELATLRTRIDELENELTSQKREYQDKLAELRENEATLKNQLSNSRDELKNLKETYQELKEQSGNLEEIVSERNKLRQRNELLSGKVRKLESRNAELMNLAMIKWFLAGAGVFLLGWLIGKMPRRKKIRW
ncbi:MAG: TIGR04211 family SH3 domain-containing protein [Desulfurivibrionaceae bacterium]